MIMANFNPERFGLAIMSVRMARTCIEEAWKHAITRKTFGKPLMTNQVIRAKFAAVNIISLFTMHEGRQSC
jgi:alkylation response protein AidB-like acyl-CoA dehydrogenase